MPVKGFPSTTERERNPEDQSATENHRFFRETQRRKNKKGRKKMNYEMTGSIGLISVFWCTVRHWPMYTESLEEPAIISHGG